MEINRKWAMPNKNTFTIKPISELLEKHIGEMSENCIVIDPFANDGILSILKNPKFKYITNDLDENYETDYHLDALEFLQAMESNSADAILFDPPYSPRQVSESYKALGKTVNMQTTQASYWTKLKTEIARVLRNGGICITCSWNSGGIGKKYGCEIEEILLVAHGGWHNDTIVVVDRKNA